MEKWEEVGGWPFLFWREVSAPVGKRRGQCLLCFSEYLSSIRESCRPSSKRSLFHWVCLYLPAYLTKTLHSPCMWGSPKPLSWGPPSSLTLSSSGKWDRLQVCSLRGGFTAAECLKPLIMTPQLPQFTVCQLILRPKTQLNHIYACQPRAYSIYHTSTLILKCDQLQTPPSMSK